MGEDVDVEPKCIEAARERPSIFWRVGRFLVFNAFSRIVVGAVMVIASLVVIQIVVAPLRRQEGADSGAVVLGLELLAAMCACTAVMGAYAVFVRLYERRWPSEMAMDASLMGLGGGFVLGTALISATSVLILLFGWTQSLGVAPSEQWAGLVIRALIGNLVVACFEETLMRGIFFRIVEESLGSWLALGLSALLFGVLHIGNPNATWTAALAISIEAGVLLAAAYMVTRSLWLPIGIHWAWNLVQEGVIGGALSGAQVRSIVTTKAVGPEWLSGGAFGVEASMIAVLLCTSVGIVFCGWAVKAGEVRRPFWARGKQAQPAAVV